jgi:DNA (cytosine-5)-methyltransferase 1
MGKLRVLDLFSGIGGFSLGLEKTGGFKTIAFCEIAKFQRKILQQHWPKTTIFTDVRNVGKYKKVLLEQHGSIDVICGGFPCQDISRAGKGAGIEGEESGLWKNYLGLIETFKPRYVIIENVGRLLDRGLAAILKNLHAVGYDAEWHCIPAFYVGSPQERDRVWIVAYPMQPGQTGRRASGISWWGGGEGKTGQDGRDRDAKEDVQFWTEPDVGRVAYGVPDAVDRINSLGNAIVPQIAELIGHAILDAERKKQ